MHVLKLHLIGGGASSFSPVPCSFRFFRTFSFAHAPMSRTHLYGRDAASESPAVSFTAGAGFFPSSNNAPSRPTIQAAHQQQQRPSRPTSIAPAPPSLPSARPPRPLGVAPRPQPQQEDTVTKLRRSSSSRSLIGSIYLPPAGEAAFRELSTKHRAVSAYDLLDTGVIP